MYRKRVRWVLLVAALAVAAPFHVALSQPAKTPLARACQKVGIHVGPHRFETLQGKPFKLALETCLDGTAWTNLFNFNLRFDAKLDNVQDCVDAFINSKVNSCDGKDYAVIVKSLDVDSASPVKDQQNIALAFDAVATRCAFPKFTADLSVKVPLSLNICTLRVVHGQPVVTIQKRGLVGWAAVYIPGLREYIAAQTVAQIERYLKD